MQVVLRDIRQDDIEQVRIWRNSPEVSMNMYTDTQITPEKQAEWFEKIKKNTSSQYWIVEANGKSVGVASLININPSFGSCSWTFYLGDPAASGGLGAKIEFEVINYVFDTLKLNKLVCEVFVFNSKVIQLHEKFGFRREAYFRQHVKKNGRYEDVVGLALLKSEWEGIRNSLEQKIYRGRS